MPIMISFTAPKDACPDQRPALKELDDADVSLQSNNIGDARNQIANAKNLIENAPARPYELDPRISFPYLNALLADNPGAGVELSGIVSKEVAPGISSIGASLKAAVDELDGLQPIDAYTKGILETKINLLNYILGVTKTVVTDLEALAKARGIV